MPQSLSSMLSVPTLSLLLLLLLPGSSHAHVGLYYPPARTYALDFLDNDRTQPPCGMQRGRGPVTDLEAGSTFVVSWYLGYAHHGGYRLELMQYDDLGQVNGTYNLTSDGNSSYVGADDVTRTSHEVTLPSEVTSCYNCTIRLLRQVLEWGQSYIFWSCADVNILPKASYTGSCLGNGSYDTSTKTCECQHAYSGFRCQFQDECEVDADCGSHGQCVRVTHFSYPQKQCFCQPGYFGLTCQSESELNSTEFDESLYVRRTLSTRPQATLYYRIIGTTDNQELEVVIQAKTESFIGFGWKPRGKACVQYSQRLGRPGTTPAVPEGEGEPENEPASPKTTTPRPEGEPEGEPQRTTTPSSEGEPEGELPGTTTPSPEGEPEGELQITTAASPEGEPEGEPQKTTTPSPEGEPEGEPIRSTTPRPEGEPEGEPQRTTTPSPEGEPEGEPLKTTTPRPEGEPESEPESTPEPEGGPGDVNGMDCADIVIGAAVGQLSRVRDYYTADRSTPRHDEFYGGTQSLTAAVASQSDDGVTTVIFRRPLTATEQTDHTICDELMTAIWSHGQIHPDIEYFYPPDEIKYHGNNRGILSLNFFSVYSVQQFLKLLFKHKIHYRRRDLYSAAIQIV